jgi:hypothetical protein
MKGIENVKWMRVYCSFAFFLSFVKSASFLLHSFTCHKTRKRIKFSDHQTKQIHSTFRLTRKTVKTQAMERTNQLIVLDDFEVLTLLVHKIEMAIAAVTV